MITKNIVVMLWWFYDVIKFHPRLKAYIIIATTASLALLNISKKKILIYNNSVLNPALWQTIYLWI